MTTQLSQDAFFQLFDRTEVQVLQAKLGENLEVRVRWAGTPTILQITII